MDPVPPPTDPIPGAIEDITSAILADIRDLINGATDDIANFGIGIARNAAQAAVVYDPATRAELFAKLEVQARALAELQRIEANRVLVNRIHSTTLIVSNLAVNLLRRWAIVL